MLTLKTKTLAEFNRKRPDDSEMPAAQPEPQPLGSAEKLMQKISAQRPDLLMRPNFMLLHERGCASGVGELCDCDATAAVGGSVLRLRD